MVLIQPFIIEKLEAVFEQCKHHEVLRLDLFGSSTMESFDSDSSDLDFLVEFRTLPPAKHADAFFGLMDGLSAIFERPVDLIEERTVQNPYLRQSIEQSRVNLYAGA